MNKQVKSRKRVSDHGEVFTSKREVDAMLDLVKDETVRIESRFLEPACGNGNFLAEILRRKLNVVKARYMKSQLEFERYAVLAVSSIYGVELLQDNVEECRIRLFGIFDDIYTNSYFETSKDKCRRSVQFILNRNILWGDALSLKTPDDKAEPIVFSEWSAVNSVYLKRRDFTLANLMMPRGYGENTLFSDLGEEVLIPKPIADYPLIHFLKLGEDDSN